MSRRALRACLCATAALAFLLAAFLPWFESRRFGVDEGDGARATYQLHGGERCEGRRCQDVSYAGGRGLRDDLFAALGWATLAGTLGSASLALGVAAVRRRQRPLRAWAAASAAVTAGLGALFVAMEIVSRKDDVARGYGLTAAIAGAIIAGVAIALPDRAAPPDRRPERRWALAAVIAGGAIVAWVSLASHGWWHGVGTFRSMASSPLGLELCDGDECQTVGMPAWGSSFVALGSLTVLLTGALLVPAIGTATRCAQDRAPGAWGVSALVLAIAALASGTWTAATRVHDAVGTVSWGLPAFGVGLVMMAVATLLARQWVTAVEVDPDEAEPAQAAAERPRALRPGPHAPRPVLAPLGASAAPAPARSATDSLAITAPRVVDATLHDRAPAGALVGPPLLDATIPDRPAALADATIADRPAALADATIADRAAFDPRAHVWGPPASAPSRSSPYAPPAALAAQTPSAAQPAQPAALAAPSSPYAPGAPASASSPYAPGAPASPYAPRPAAAPRPGPAAAPRPGSQGPATAPAAPAALARRASPACPRCKQATLWHSKRAAWWCSACKRAL